METSQKVAVAALVGIGGWVYYRYVYLPQKLRGIIAAQAAAAGMSSDAYMAKIGAVACQGIAAYYGIPPTVTGGVCQSVGGVAAGVVQQAPSWLSSIGQSAASSTVAAGQALGVALPAVGSGVGGLVTGVVGGVGGAVKTVTDVSVYSTKQVGSLIKQGVVGASMLPVDVAKSVVGGVGSVAKGVGHVFSSIF